MNARIIAEPTSEQLSEKLAAHLSELAANAIQERGVWTFALSGGSTPKKLYQLLASPAWKEKFEWEKIVLLLGDDRAVLPDDVLSNVKLARETLADFVPARFERIATENPDLDAAAADYETKIREFGERVDCVLLGLGSDGHTASLFPHSPQLNEMEKRVTATPISSLEPFVRRVTFTFPEINNARSVLFLVTGADKAEKVERIVKGAPDIENLPATGVVPTNGELAWFLDADAARLVA